jgi:hypothetical protein
MRRVQITPLSPHDRVIFQEALAGDDSVTTRIVGSGFYRRVLVIPRGHESEGSVAEEFNEEGQMVGYPMQGAADEEGPEGEETTSSPDVALTPPIEEPGSESAQDAAKTRGEES